MKKIKLAVLFFIIAQTGILYSQTTPEQIFSKGLEAFYGANFQEGVKYFSEYITSAPTDFRGYNYRGLCNQSMKNYQNSIEDFTSAINLSKNNSEGFVNRGNSYLMLGNFSSAITDFSDAIKFEPNNIEGYTGRARVYTQQGKYSNALSDLNSAIGVDPKNPRIYLSKAWIHILNNDTTKIQEDISLAMYYDSNIVFTDSKRELLYVKIDNYKKVLSVMNDRVNKFPGSYLSYFSRGVVYFLMNKYSNSVSDLKKSLGLYTGNDQEFKNLVNQILRSIKRNS